MNDGMTDVRVHEALETCASEPVRTPGIIQPFGYLIASDIASGVVRHASENCGDLFRKPLREIFGKHLRDLLGPEIWHAAANYAGLGETRPKRYFAGLWPAGENGHAINLSRTADTLVLEIESLGETPTVSPEMIREQSFLINEIQQCSDLPTLFDRTTRLLRHVTGFDRVMLYQFDPSWNGEVLAEARKGSLEPFLGLRFPHWDIPEQARAIMLDVDIRMISDVDQTPVPIMAQSEGLPPLDITHAQMRGVSEVHMQYLRNMGTGSSLTLSVVLDGHLWGIISFHHERPMVLAPEIRSILTSGVLPVFCLKLGLQRNETSMRLVRRVEDVQQTIQNSVDRRLDVTQMLSVSGPDICHSLGAHGIALLSGAQTHRFGITLPDEVIEDLVSLAWEHGSEPLMIDDLATVLPKHLDKLEDTAGVIIHMRPDARGLMLFRPAIVQRVNWAGNPEKTIETVDGNARLQPRGSFARYLEETRGCSQPWTDGDRRLVKQLSPLLSAIERQSFLNDLTRQQLIMIGELNHRVRNILALVRSVSSQARKEGGSLESYSQALEARVEALAAAHDIGAGAALAAVSIRKIIELETAPYQEAHTPRISVGGSDIAIRAELAPLLALVIHEMMTNAVKYGAVSGSEGTIDIDIQHDSEGTQVTWVERGGPPVSEPKRLGFGTTLIKQAVPHELGGTSELSFLPEGVVVNLFIPSEALEAVSQQGDEKRSIADAVIADAPSRLNNGLIMVVEDNYMIALGLQTDLNELGYPNTEVFGSARQALEFLEQSSPALALLDWNLGAGTTSLPIATELRKRKVPVVIVTGYGARVSIPPELDKVPVLTKPATQKDLLNCFSRLIT